jgi:hypothetical protein
VSAKVVEMASTLLFAASTKSHRPSDHARNNDGSPKRKNYLKTFRKQRGM